MLLDQARPVVRIRESGAESKVRLVVSNPLPRRLFGRHFRSPVDVPDIRLIKRWLVGLFDEFFAVRIGRNVIGDIWVPYDGSHGGRGVDESLDSWKATRRLERFDHAINSLGDIGFGCW